MSAQEKQQPRSLLSLSIDLTGSTKVKQAIVNNSGSDPDHREKLYSDFRKILYLIEQSFYFLVEHQPELTLERLFLVKTIGDEFWYVYDVSRAQQDDLRRSAEGLISATLGLFSKSNYLRIPSRRLNRGEDLDELPDVSWTNYNLPLKGTIDLVDDVVELNLERKDLLDRHWATILAKRKLSAADLGKKIAELYDRFNIGGGNAFTGTTLRSSVRTDYIGLDIDRFFRVSKHCKSGMLLAGQTLIQELDHTITDVSPELAHLGVKALGHKMPLSSQGSSRMIFHQVIKQELKPHELKGIRDPYDIYHLFGTSSLRPEVFFPDPYTDGLMEQTRGFLAEHGYYAIDGNLRLP